ncbi:MAG: hypothetical protein K6T85_01170 [Gorillibacterium sp.]|nr:hypothetical protein [Gorillibacterium sp.]
MSDFMKSIVAEVLERNRSDYPSKLIGPVAAKSGISPIGNCSVDHKEDCTLACGQSESCVKQLSTIKRTNYQKEKAAKRLAAFTGQISDQPAVVVPPPSQKQTVQVAVQQSLDHPGRISESGISATKRFVEESLSPLLRLTLAKEQPAIGDYATPARAPLPEGRPISSLWSEPDKGKAVALPPTQVKAIYTASAAEISKASPLKDAAIYLGPTDDSSCTLWFFPSIREELRTLLGITNRRHRTVGIVGASLSSPDQLFAVDAVLTGTAKLDMELVWGEAGKGFELKLFGEDPELMVSKLRALADRLQNAKEKTIQAYVSLQPTPLLVRYLGTRQQEALGLVTGICRLNSIGLLDRLLERHPTFKLTIRVEARYLVLTGAPNEVSIATKELQEDAIQLFGAHRIGGE